MATILSKPQVRVESLLNYIPEAIFPTLAQNTKVDYKVHKLYGRSMFYLLLYGLISDERIGQRSLADFFNSAKFQAFAKLDHAEQICHSSLSDHASELF